MGNVLGFDALEAAALLAQFSANTGAARRACARLVGQGRAADDPMRDVQGQLFRGGGDVSLQDLTPGVC